MGQWRQAAAAGTGSRTDGSALALLRTLGVSGAVELVLDRVDDKYAFFNHQKSPIMRSRGIFFEDSLTQGEVGERRCRRRTA